MRIISRPRPFRTNNLFRLRRFRTRRYLTSRGTYRVGGISQQEGIATLNLASRILRRFYRGVASQIRLRRNFRRLPADLRNRIRSYR